MFCAAVHGHGYLAFGMITVPNCRRLREIKMKNTLIKSTVVAAVLALSATVQAEPGSSGDYSGSSSQSQTQRGNDDSRGMENRSGSGQVSGSGQYGESGDSMQHMQLTGDADRDFAVRMKLHHQQGLAMAQMQLEEGKSPQMKSMAKKIIANQKKEIAQFDKWLGMQQ